MKLWKFENTQMCK